MLSFWGAFKSSCKAARSTSLRNSNVPPSRGISGLLTKTATPARPLGLKLEHKSLFAARTLPLQRRASHNLAASKRFFSQAPPPSQPLPLLPPKSVGIWLMISSTLVFSIIVVGGVTRLTESGLSITEWKPITGVIPPLTQQEWEQEFTKYKATPEFKL
jgi:heme a synthase